MVNPDPYPVEPSRRTVILPATPAGSTSLAARWTSGVDSPRDAARAAAVAATPVQTNDSPTSRPATQMMTTMAVSGSIATVSRATCPESLARCFPAVRGGPAGRGE